MSRLLLDHAALHRPEDDLLDRGPLAATLADMVVELTATGGTVGLLGPWGSGKTSIRSILARELQNRRVAFDYRLISVNPWAFERSDVAAQVTIAVAAELDKQRPFTVWLPPALKPQALRNGLYASRTATSLSLLPGEEGLAAEQHSWRWMTASIVLMFMLMGLASTHPLAGTALGALTIFGGQRLFGMLDGFLVHALQRFRDEPFSNSSVSLPRATEHTPMAAAERLRAIGDHLRIHNQQTLVVWMEDLDRCEPATAVQVLSLLRTLFAVPGIIFLVECDAQALTQTLATAGVDADGLLRKVLTHTLPLPTSPTTLTRALLGRASHELSIPDDVLDVVLAGVGSRPRALKRVVERISASRAVMERRGAGGTFPRDLSTDLRAIAVIEVVREQWPTQFAMIDEDPHLLESWIASVVASGLEHGTNPLAFMRFLDAVRVLQIPDWSFYLQLSVSATTLADDNVHQLLVAALNGKFEEIKARSVAAAARGDQQKMAQLFVELLPDTPAARKNTLRTMQTLRAVFTILALPEYAQVRALTAKTWNVLGSQEGQVYLRELELEHLTVALASSRDVREADRVLAAVLAQRRSSFVDGGVEVLIAWVRMGFVSQMGSIGVLRSYLTEWSGNHGRTKELVQFFGEAPPDAAVLADAAFISQVCSQAIASIGNDSTRDHQPRLDALCDWASRQSSHATKAMIGRMLAEVVLETPGYLTGLQSPDLALSAARYTLSGLSLDLVRAQTSRAVREAYVRLMGVPGALLRAYVCGPSMTDEELRELTRQALTAEPAGELLYASILQLDDVIPALSARVRQACAALTSEGQAWPASVELIHDLLGRGLDIGVLPPNGTMRAQQLVLALRQGSVPATNAVDAAVQRIASEWCRVLVDGTLASGAHYPDCGPIQLIAGLPELPDEALGQVSHRIGVWIGADAGGLERAAAVWHDLQPNAKVRVVAHDGGRALADGLMKRIHSAPAEALPAMSWLADLSASLSTSTQISLVEPLLGMVSARRLPEPCNAAVNTIVQTARDEAREIWKTQMDPLLALPRKRPNNQTALRRALADPTRVRVNELRALIA